MSKFLCLQRSIPTATRERPSPAEMQQMYARFTAWREQFGAHIVDLGGRLGAGTLATDGPLDGPLVEVKELVGGYMIVTADSLERAVEIAQACPGVVGPGSAVEVIEILGP